MKKLAVVADDAVLSLWEVRAVQVRAAVVMAEDENDAKIKFARIAIPLWAAETKETSAYTKALMAWPEEITVMEIIE